MTGVKWMDYFSKLVTGVKTDTVGERPYDTL
jgi:hypothetical protein